MTESRAPADAGAEVAGKDATSAGKRSSKLIDADPAAVLKRMNWGWVPSAILLVVVVGGWQAVASSRTFNKALFPSVTNIAEAFWTLARTGELGNDIGTTLLRLVVGFVIAVVVAVPMGLLMGVVPALERPLKSVLTVLLPVPALAWEPLFILWFGIGTPPIIALVAFSSWLVITFNTWHGIRAINPAWRRAAYSMNMRGWEYFSRVMIPGSLAGILTGLRYGIAQAWRAEIAGELIAGTTTGLGYVIFTSEEYITTANMLASIVSIIILGLLIEKYTFRLIERATTVKWGMVAAQQ